MNCPSCSNPLPDQARFCPACGAGVDVAARLDVHVDVEQNMGRVVGVQTDAIHGDVYGGDIYQVQVYVLSEASRAGPVAGVAGLANGPYKFLSPYTPGDRAIFKGRQTETEQVVRRLGEGRLLVVYGPPGVGKTSLLAAGVIPELIQAGALAVHIHDYSRPLGAALRAALQGSQTQLAVSLADGEELPALLANLRSQLGGTLVLVLDQFESLFRGPINPQLYTQIMNELVTSLRQIEPEYLRLIISIEDNALVRLSDLQQALPEIFRSFMQLKPLDRDQAKTAILKPLEAFKPPPVYLPAEFVDSLLIPDLIELSPEMPGAVYPPHLQIICHHLFESAVRLSPPLIDQGLYLKAGGAEGILAGFLDETLRLGLGTDAERCNRCLVALAAAGASAWVAAEELAIDGLDRGEIQAGLERLQQAGLLISRLNQGRTEYAFTSPIVAQEVLKMAGPEIESLGQARADLERGWSGWLAHGDLIPARPLHRIAAAGQQLLPGFLQSVLLIRSSLTGAVSPAPWIPGLEGSEGRAIITALEGIPPGDPALHPSLTRLAQAKTLLGIDPELQPESAAGGFGLLAQTAVENPDPAIRGAAVLTLQVPDSHQALSRLDWALGELPGSWRRFWRTSELRGLLEDEIPTVHRLNKPLPPVQRAGIWLWRIWRAFQRNSTAILWSMLGAGLGAGLALGIWRGLVAWLAGSVTPSFLGFVHIIYGMILGAVLQVSISLGKVLHLEQTTPLAETARATRPDWHAIILGGLGFGLGLTWIFVLNGGILLSSNLLIVGMGLLAGLGLSTVLLYPREPVSQARAKEIWLRSGLAGLIFGLIQLLLGIPARRSFVITYPDQAFRADFSRFASSGFVKSLMDAFPAWPVLLSVVDAMVVGVLLGAGITAGVISARRLLNKISANG